MGLSTDALTGRAAGEGPLFLPGAQRTGGCGALFTGEVTVARPAASGRGGTSAGVLSPLCPLASVAGQVLAGRGSPICRGQQDLVFYFKLK